MKRTLRLLSAISLLGANLSCGVKGPPLPPVPSIPQQTEMGRTGSLRNPPAPSPAPTLNLDTTSDEESEDSGQVSNPSARPKFRDKDSSL